MLPIVIGNCSHLANGMSYDVPGGGKKGSNFVSESDWTVPEGLNGRIMIGGSHHHGGAKYQTLESRTCERRIFKARAYYGTRDHVYNTIRPILHEPGPIGNGTFATLQGVPITEGEVLRRVAVHDNHNLHVASMGFWSLLVRARTKRSSAAARCRSDIVDINRPKRYDRTPNYDLKVPQLAKPAGRARPRSTGTPLEIGDDFFRPGPHHGEGRPAGDVALRRHAAAQRDASRTGRAASRRSTGARPAAPTASRRR